jgi:hypothetical protein
MNTLPNEIIDQILLNTCDFNLSVILQREFVVKKLYKSKIHTWNWASKNGNLEIVEWLHENKKEGCTSDTMDLASQNGHLKVVEFLHYNRTEGCTTWVMNYASDYGHLKVVEFLYYNRIEGCTTYAMDWEVRMVI